MSTPSPFVKNTAKEYSRLHFSGCTCSVDGLMCQRKDARHRKGQSRGLNKRSRKDTRQTRCITVAFVSIIKPSVVQFKLPTVPLLYQNSFLLARTSLSTRFRGPQPSFTLSILSQCPSYFSLVAGATIDTNTGEHRNFRATASRDHPSALNARISAASRSVIWCSLGSGSGFRDGGALGSDVGAGCKFTGADGGRRSGDAGAVNME